MAIMWTASICIFVLILSTTTTTSASRTKDLMDKFGGNGMLNESQVKELFEGIGAGEWKHNGSDEKHCSSSAVFYRNYSGGDGIVNEIEFKDLCPAVLYEFTKDECRQAHDDHHHDHGGGTEDEGKAWGFGILFVTVISVGSLLGAVMVPFMAKSVFQWILLGMVSLAVGVLCGSGIFHLIPHALHLGHDDLDYMWKLVMVAVGIYIFFLLECVMKMYLHFKSARPNSGDAKVNAYVNEGHGHSHFTTTEQPGINHIPDLPTKQPNGLDLAGAAEPKKEIATVAWMIIIGDGLHNFIDGLAIGVSCSTSVLSGLSTSLAILCEELPHELGDFAILLNSGMSYKQAMLANFLSACFCYLGLIVGLVLGFKTSAVHYIYGLAGGMFFYIALVDMLPESIELLQRASGNSKWRTFKLMLVQNFYILFGFGAMLVLAFYAHEIKHAEW